MENPYSKTYVFLTILYITLLIICCACLNKSVDFGFGYTITAAGLPFPFALVILDITAEVYGYKSARILIWAGFLALLLFAFGCNFLIHLPSSNSLANNALVEVFKNTTRASVVWVLSGIVADFVNAYAITKWKILLRGRFFWFRSVASSAIGQIIYSLINVLIILSGSYYNVSDFFKIILIIYIYKMAVIGILAIPATFFTKFLKRVEKIDIYDYKTNFNPFKLN